MTIAAFGFFSWIVILTVYLFILASMGRHARNNYFLTNSLIVIVFGNLPKILHFDKLFCILFKCFGDFFRHKLCLHKVLIVTHQCCMGSKKVYIYNADRSWQMAD